nr:hypothetical protein [Marinicella sp. W31]MDC2876142.1 hypothetical protein [Marinicella sp. W31]
MPAKGIIRLGLDIDGVVLQFRYAIDEDEWLTCGPTLDASMLSDESGRGVNGSFTGTFIGMAAYDLAGGEFVADFSRFKYQNQ